MFRTVQQVSLILDLADLLQHVPEAPRMSWLPPLTSLTSHSFSIPMTVSSPSSARTRISHFQTRVPPLQQQQQEQIQMQQQMQAATMRGVDQPEMKHSVIL